MKWIYLFELVVLVFTSGLINKKINFYMQYSSSVVH